MEWSKNATSSKITHWQMCIDHWIPPWVHESISRKKIVVFLQIESNFEDRPCFLSWRACTQMSTKKSCLRSPTLTLSIQIPNFTLLRTICRRHFIKIHLPLNPWINLTVFLTHNHPSSFQTMNKLNLFLSQTHELCSSSFNLWINSTHLFL